MWLFQVWASGWLGNKHVVFLQHNTEHQLEMVSWLTNWLMSISSYITFPYSYYTLFQFIGDIDNLLCFILFFINYKLSTIPFSVIQTPHAHHPTWFQMTFYSHLSIFVHCWFMKKVTHPKHPCFTLYLFQTQWSFSISQNHHGYIHHSMAPLPIYKFSVTRLAVHQEFNSFIPQTFSEFLQYARYYARECRFLS